MGKFNQTSAEHLKQVQELDKVKQKLEELGGRVTYSVPYRNAILSVEEALKIAAEATGFALLREAKSREQ